MKRILLTFLDLTAKSSLLLLQISATALLGSSVVYGVILLGRVVQPLEEPTQRVAGTAINIGAIGLSGFIASGVLYLGFNGSSESASLDKSEQSQDERDVEWEKLVQALWGTEYCLASCKGCKHLVGEVTSSNYMVCAIHPYGQKDCLDWEKL